MRRLRASLLALTATLALVAVGASPAVAAPRTLNFSLIFHGSVSNSCPPGVLTCATVLVPGFGRATATFTGTSFIPGVPEPNCFTAGGIVGVTLQSDGSTLLLATEQVGCTPGASGTAPGTLGTSGGPPFLAEGTWSVIGGAGIFAGATGGGTASTNNAGDVSVSRYFGTITLP